MAVLALVIAALLGMLLFNCFLLRRQLASYNDLSLQYSALSGDYDELKTYCATQEQTVLDAQDRAESAERELEAMRQTVICAAPTPKPTEQSGVDSTVQKIQETNDPAESPKEEEYP